MVQPLQPGQQRPLAGLLRRPGGEATGPGFAELLPRLFKSKPLLISAGSHQALAIVIEQSLQSSLPLLLLKLALFPLP